jgi:hypothetical protein
MVPFYEVPQRDSNRFTDFLDLDQIEALFPTFIFTYVRLGLPQAFGKRSLCQAGVQPHLPQHCDQPMFSHFSSTVYSVLEYSKLE